MGNELQIAENVSGVIDCVQDVPVFEEEDFNFLVEHKHHLGLVLKNTQMWRTDIQKESIISDGYHPNTHSKFTQAILEQKVHFDQSMYLAKDFELKKLELDEKELDMSELDESPRSNIKKKRLSIEIDFIKYELGQMKIAMVYRMKEVRGWQAIQERLITEMKESGMKDEDIWSSKIGELESFFFISMNRLQGVKVTKDSAELQNLTTLARSSVDLVKKAGILESVIKRCNAEQQDSLRIMAQMGFFKKEDLGILVSEGIIKITDPSEKQ